MARRLYRQRSDARLERFAPYRWVSTALRRLGLPAHYKRRFRPKFDDLEAEITYLLIRHRRPAAILEVAPYYAWSTTWLLQAVRDNGSGQVHSYDLVDYSRRTVPPDLARGRWSFTRGDIREHVGRLPRGIGYLFLDAAHTAEFAAWYVREVLPRLPAGTLVGVHDIFRGAAPPMPESAVLLDWLRDRGIACFTAAAGHPGGAYDSLMTVKRELGLAEPIHDSVKNPMAFFRLP
ncbi:MAG: class I SAM-dependent methyltransferase [Gemmatimonadales bacterium]